MKVRRGIRAAAVAAALAVAMTAVPTGAATYPAVQKLTASDASAGDMFGRSVATEAGAVFVGQLTGSGAVYVFRDEGAGLVEQQTLTASDASPGAAFGLVAAANGRLYVGAPNADPDGTSSGAVYVFEPDASGYYIEVARLRPSDAAAGRRFGFVVAADGDRVVAMTGATGERSTAYVFEADGAGAFDEVAKLVAADAPAAGLGNRDVAIDGNTVVMGVDVDDDLGSESGSAYVFEGDEGGGFVQTQKLTASDGGPSEFFGAGVAVEGDTIAVGANRHNDNRGALYVFERTGGAFVETAKLAPEDLQPSDFFGYEPVIDEGRIAALALSGDAEVPDAGAVYLFERGADGYEQDTRLTTPDSAGATRFGYGLDLADRSLVAGARLDDERATDAGAAYVFDVVPDEPAPCELLIDVQCIVDTLMGELSGLPLSGL